MSYALEVKEELSRIEFDTSEESFAALEAIFKNGFTLSFQGSNRFKLEFSSRSNAIIRFLIKQINSFHHTKYELYQRQIMRFDKPVLYYLEIKDEAEIFIEEFNMLKDSRARKTEILDSDELKKAYLRGAFIAKGSINDPETSNYHLELSLNNDNEAIFIQSIINSYNYNARIIKRREHYVVYLKEIDSICDILRLMGAKNTVFRLEEAMINRKVKHDVKRQVNFELANQDKTNEASRNELRYIKYLEYYYPLENLDPKLLLVMKVRKENPYASLTELSDIIYKIYDERLSKSCLAHRFRKLKEIAIDYQNRRN